MASPRSVTVEHMPEVLDADPRALDAILGAEPNRLVVIAFHGPGCPNCAAFESELPSLLEALRSADMRLVCVDAYAHSELALRFGLSGVPSFVFVRGGRARGRITGYPGRQPWLSIVRDQLAKPTA